MNTRQDQIDALDAFLLAHSSINGDTRALFEQIARFRMQLPNNVQIEKHIRSITESKSTPVAGAQKRGLTYNDLVSASEQKKIENQSEQQTNATLVELDKPEPPSEPVQTDDSKLLDIWTDGQAKAEKDYKDVKHFIAEIGKLGMQISGKNFKQAWADFDKKYSQIVGNVPSQA